MQSGTPELNRPQRDARTAGGDRSAPIAPSVALPRGGGAIRGIGEKFSANPVNGTATLSIPIATSAGRSGGAPDLTLSYDSGAGNGPFGWGWRLSLPSIVRKTDKGLPRYRDAEYSDVFMMGADDLVPVLVAQGSQWRRETLPPRVRDGQTYAIQRYRPRIEGAFTRIERWSNTAQPSDVCWRTITRDNVTTWYGKSADSRIADPADASKIFQWLPCESLDDKGNAIVYVYAREDGANLPPGLLHERNRTADDRAANRYLKRIKYGNVDSHLVHPDLETAEWMFEVVFDYDEGHLESLDPPGRRDGDVQRVRAASLRSNTWPVRPDPFSTGRPSFDLRTYRRCRRVLMFHALSELGAEPCLVAATEFEYDSEGYSRLRAVTQSRFLRDPTQAVVVRNGARLVTYRKRAMPPLELEYSRTALDEDLRVVASDALENLPVGVDQQVYEWVDLDGEGLPGILMQFAGGWYYKRNLGNARFGALEQLPDVPSLAAAVRRSTLMDLDGDGRMEAVMLTGATAGAYERTHARGWRPFRPFTSLPAIDWDTPNLRFIDLTGDGRADVLVTADEVLTWYRSQGETGFCEGGTVRQALDEERGPKLVFNDGTQSIFLADMCGDGLLDLVRVTNGEICYWPNLGYGRFGDRVSMDDAPRFDRPGEFDARRVRLADIDGTGTTDLVYLAADGVRLYFNASGNRWSTPRVLPQCPPFDDLSSVAVVDLLGNGTACLVWSLVLPHQTRRSMQFIDLMGGAKPHLLVRMRNNLGAETELGYAPSTKFYLADREARTPWATRIPFPVHCVETVTVRDRWRQTTFSTTYAYHHGHFDSDEREFRGFGRIDQVDVESYGTFAAGNPSSPYVSNDRTLYQPPVKTITWYETGALDEDHRSVSYRFEQEYFLQWFERQHPGAAGAFREHVPPRADLDAAALSAADWRQAIRACKGTLLRHEQYELDVDALERGHHRPVRLFSAAQNSCRVRAVQPSGPNPHAVFIVCEDEAVGYQYDLDLQSATVAPDPRVAHTINLAFDERGNVLQSVAVMYPRRGQFEADGLEPRDLAALRALQSELHVTCTETVFTGDVTGDDTHRPRVPWELRSYEVTGIAPVGRYFTRARLSEYRLNAAHQPGGLPVGEVAFHELPDRVNAQRRLIDHRRTLFFDDTVDPPIAPLPPGTHGRLGLVFDSFKLALTGPLLTGVFGAKLTAGVRATFETAGVSGYLTGAPLTALFPGLATAGEYWLRSGTTGFAAAAASSFYLPVRFADPFGNVTTVEYDVRHLFVASTSDPVGNTSRVKQFDYRVLAPREVEDANGNLSEVGFDILGLPVATALKGKGVEGDTLAGFEAVAHPPESDVVAFFTGAAFDEVRARQWLAGTTTRHVYYFGEQRTTGGAVTWAQHPACACEIVRDQHVRDLAAGEESPVRVSFAYTDGLGAAIVKKVQAEPAVPGGPLRWVASGRVVVNNKGVPVKQYEPYFSRPESGHRFEQLREEGISPVFYFDALGRSVRVENPDGSFSRTERSPWHTAIYDVNDTVTEPGNAWQATRMAPGASAEDRQAAMRTSDHGGTPMTVVLDSVGRETAVILHNRSRDAAGAPVDHKHVTITRLDHQSRPLWIRDARRNLVMQYVMPPVAANAPGDPAGGYIPAYDLLGRRLYQRSMDAGDSWALSDAAGRPLLAWDHPGRMFRVEHDALRRPIGSVVVGADPLDSSRAIQYEKVVYGEPAASGLTDARARVLNLRGRVFRHHDSSGRVTSLGTNPVTGAEEAFDFKGNALRSVGQFLRDYRGLPDWSGAPALETESFHQATKFDARNRPVQTIGPYSDRPGTPINVTQFTYGIAGLTERVDVWLEAAAEPAGLLDPGTATQHIVNRIDRNAKGHRVRLEHGQGAGLVVTSYTYDPLTFRVARVKTERPNHPEGARRILQDLAYTYDPLGNITHVRDAAQNAVFHSNACVASGAEYRYDALYRLTAAAGREHTGGNTQPGWDEDSRRHVGIPNDCQALRNYVEAYRYDAVGNLLQVRHHQGGNLESPGAVLWNRRGQYALASNRLLATSLPGDPDNLPDYIASPGYSAKYTYDDRGGMLSMPHLPALEWNVRNELAASQRQAAGGAPEKTFYVYASTAGRTRKITERADGTRRDERIYLGEVELYRRFGSDGQTVTLERETLHAADDHARIAMIETRTRLQGADPAPRRLVRFHHGNWLGSSTLEVDEQADVISYEEYHPYGSSAYQAARSAVDTPKRYRYTGRERDEETGFTYHTARYYAPWLGRWTASDPAGLAGGFNLYEYGHSNPTRFVDPGGTDCTDIVATMRPDKVFSAPCAPDPYHGGSIPDASLSGPSQVKPKSAATAPSAPPKRTVPKAAPAHKAAPAPSPAPGPDRAPQPDAEDLPPLPPPNEYTGPVEEEKPPPEPTHEWGWRPVTKLIDKIEDSAIEDLKKGQYGKAAGKWIGSRLLKPFTLSEDLAIWNWPDHFLSAGQYAKRWIWYDRRGRSARGLWELFKGHMEASSIVGSFEILGAGLSSAITHTPTAGASTLEKAIPSLPQRGEQLFNELGARMVKNPDPMAGFPGNFRRQLTVSIVEPFGGGGMRIVTVQNPRAHQMLASGQVRLLPNEVLGPAPFKLAAGESWLLKSSGYVHSEITGVWLAMAMDTEGGLVYTTNKACASTCGPLFSSLSNWVHLNL